MAESLQKKIWRIYRTIGNLINRIPRTTTIRFFVLLIAYTAVFGISRWLSFELKWNFRVPSSAEYVMKWGWVYELPLRLALLGLFGQFGGLLSYFSIPDLKRVIAATTIGSAILLLIWYLPTSATTIKAIPRSVLLLDWILSTNGIILVRLALRMIREYYRTEQLEFPKHGKRVVVIGAGDVGASLVREFLARRGMGFQPVAFLDDDPNKKNCRIHGIPVYGKPEQLKEIKDRLNVQTVVFAIPSAPVKRLRELIQLCNQLGLEHYIVPSVDQLTTGQVRISQIRPVEIEDLLGREEVRLDDEQIAKLLQGKVVMVTGAGGSIGSELCRQIVSKAPRSLLMVERSEYLLFQITEELRQRGFGGLIVPLIGDVLDKVRMEEIFRRYQPDHVFHGAAHKHVPMMEYQPGEAIKNNVFGTVCVADLAAKYNVDRFVLISTDKAINPTSVMGATKRLAEIYVQSLFYENPKGTKFMAVRFGNVLGSSGSVVTIFRKQIAEGGPVTVTHPEMRRYFMTIPEAVGLVLQSATQGKGGEIFVLEMGKPVKIMDLARQMIELSGYRPNIDIEIKIIGPRPGEKLFEELCYDHERHQRTEHPKIMRFMGEPRNYKEVWKFLYEELEPAVRNGTSQNLKELLRKFIPEYTPSQLNHLVSS